MNHDFLERQDEVESRARSYPRGLPIAIKKGEGSWLQDVEGRWYIDFLSGAGVLALGHCPPRVVKAVERQLELLTHGLDLPTPVKQDFSDGVLSKLPPGMRDRFKIHFCGPTGADAVEAAVKLCKTATGRSNVVAFQGSYHGCTAGAMALTSLIAPKLRVGNPMPGVHFMPFSYCGRCPLKLNPDTCDTNCIALLESTLTDTHGGFEPPAAVIIEMVQGEGGSIPARPEFVARLREVTRSVGVPLIVDEIQTGWGRTGDWFAFERYGIEPDVILLSKAIGAGFPVSVILYDKAFDVWEPGAHIGTFRGNQLAFAAGLENLAVFEDEDILGNVRQRSAEAMEFLANLANELDLIKEVRGVGLMIGVELRDTDEGREAARQVQKFSLKKGLIIERGGRDDLVLRLLPPLNIAGDVLLDGLGRFASALREAAASCR